MRQRSLNVSPTGLRHSTTWRLTLVAEQADSTQTSPQPQHTPTGIAESSLTAQTVIRDTHQICRQASNDLSNALSLWSWATILRSTNLTLSMKKAAKSSCVSPTPAAFAAGRTSSNTLENSSLGNRFGTSPLVRMLLTSSRNVSYLICNNRSARSS